MLFIFYQAAVPSKNYELLIVDSLIGLKYYITISLLLVMVKHKC